LLNFAFGPEGDILVRAEELAKIEAVKG